VPAAVDLVYFGEPPASRSAWIMSRVALTGTIGSADP